MTTASPKNTPIIWGCHFWFDSKSHYLPGQKINICENEGGQSSWWVIDAQKVGPSENLGVVEISCSEFIRGSWYLKSGVLGVFCCPCPEFRWSWELTNTIRNLPQAPELVPRLTPTISESSDHRKMKGFRTPLRQRPRTVVTPHWQLQLARSKPTQPQRLLSQHPRGDWLTEK